MKYTNSDQEMTDIRQVDADELIDALVGGKQIIIVTAATREGLAVEIGLRRALLRRPELPWAAYSKRFEIRVADSVGSIGIVPRASVEDARGMTFDMLAIVPPLPGLDEVLMEIGPTVDASGGEFVVFLPPPLK